MRTGVPKRIVTDASWKSRPGPILSSDFMYGEDYDRAVESTVGIARPG